MVKNLRIGHAIALGLAWTVAAAMPVTAQDSQRVLTVAADGSAEFRSVQAAVDAVPEGNAERVVIRICPGVYRERLVVPREKPYITFRGEDAHTTVLTYGLHARSPKPDGAGEVGTTGSSSTFLKGDDFVAERITFANDTPDGVAQAVAVKVEGDRMTFRDVRFLGWQDTLYAHGRSMESPAPARQYYRDCYIEGDVDFIFGSATAVFENCDIHSKSAGYVTAASTPAHRAHGYVFLDCRLTKAPGVEPATVYLGRPWRDHAAVVFIRTWMDDHVRPEGWHNWSRPEREATSRYAEYASHGPGAAPEARVPWAKRLSDDEAAAYTAARILAGDDGWDPTVAH